ncbi:hypothetical protein KJ359_012227 [Pestalotiopsis sp. 9143b]|nr:hypothetical protein KJ359_012227 [Pestalotiopsis sp. 9143b]
MMSATTSPMGDLDYPAWTPSSASSKASSLRGGELPPWTPLGAGVSPQTAVGMSIKAVKPPRPISKDPPPRPMTASTKRLTVTRYDKPRPIKFGTGKDGDIELVPQPSDDSEDPLNLNFYALLHMVALVGVAKTMFVTVHSDVALANGVSYTAAVALTGVPLCVSALTGMLSLVVAKVYGKRPIYLASTLFMFIGTMWEAAKDYISRMRPWTFRVSLLDSTLLLRAPRAMVTPTILLLFSVSLLPYAALWGFASSLSLLFSVMPFMLPTHSIGALLTGPFIFATVIMITLALPLYTARFTSTIHYTTLAIGAIVASVGTFGFGLYIEGSMVMSGNGTRNSLGTMWTLDAVGANISFPVVSFLLGLLAAGSLTLDATIRPMIQRSISFTSVNLSAAMRSTIDMHAGLTCLRNLVAGAFIIGLPNAVWAWDGLRSAALGIGIAQFFIAGTVGCVWWQWQEHVWRLDGKVIGAIDPSAAVLSKSYFDTS